MIELYRIPTEGGEPQKLLEMEGLSSISVHPDGRRIAFANSLGFNGQQKPQSEEQFVILPGHPSAGKGRDA